jgi:DNA-binding response OmpR family regulator
VVDDEDTVRGLLADTLRFAGFEVSTAATGDEAVRGAADDPVLAPWAGFGVLAAFGAVVLAAAFLVFGRRDV